ncbi:glycoside hydrolase [Sphingobacterium olei]|uniref:Glycoside hydrolase n=1 Tax=Sphingobacterium olei TaxID=2571155 RepID=A0A4V5MMR0_9SPHI|nr:glycosyl hydrolase [Sphingobacterium olei]TJZ61118.1 glycoside hydrolase [Sphingobacterium olei]
MKKIVAAVMLSLTSSMSISFAQDLWPSVTKEMKPWTRWWWLGSAVDKPNLDRELKLFEKAGFGGVEVTPIYGAKNYEKRYVQYLSPTWMEMLDFTTSTSNKLGMGVDINLGTGWPFGGPQIEEKDAATRVFLDEIIIKKGEKLHFPIKVSDAKQTYSSLQALRAYTSSGEEINLDAFIRSGDPAWTAPENVNIIALFSGRTRQKVKRAAPGGEGFTLDHLGTSSVQTYFQRFEKAFSDRQLNVRSFFNDSYEVYGANWTDGFLGEFEQLKGYKLQDQLIHFAGKSTDLDKQARVKSDYREVVSAILKNNFLIPFTAFANKHGAISKNQAHGSPGNLIDLYASTDIAECETFGSSSFDIPNLRRDSADVRNVDPDPMMAKFATSATNTSGKKYTSSETFTWLTEHFKTSLSQAKPEVEQLFLAGVNHVFYHGTTYSPQDVPYPGWLFYASVNFTTNNSFWPHLSGLNQYITRVQSILQTSKADNELLIYWPIYDIWHNAKGVDKSLSVHHVDDWLHPTEFYKQSVRLQKMGFSFDFVTDDIIGRASVQDHRIITAEKANPYKVIYIPTCTYFSEKTFEKLLLLAEQGATIIFEDLPKEIHGLSDSEGRKAKLQSLIAKLNFNKDDVNQYTAYGKGKVYLTKDAQSALETEQVFGERMIRTGLKFSRRVSGEDTYYYLVNHGKSTVDQEVRLNTEGKNYILLDPQTGANYALPVRNKSIRVQLKSGYAWVILVTDDKQAEKTYAYHDDVKEVVTFSAPWKVTFTTGGPELPKGRSLSELSSWTTWNDKVANRFSGTAAYETTFKLNKEQGKSYVLELGKVAESAKVMVNGKNVGLVWAHPFEVNIEDFLNDGENTIRVEVANLMANRVRDLDVQGVQWRNYHEINFVNINYKEFDASGWKLMDSGLLGPVRILSY